METTIEKCFHDVWRQGIRAPARKALPRKPEQFAFANAALRGAVRFLGRGVDDEAVTWMWLAADDFRNLSELLRAWDEMTVAEALRFTHVEGWWRTGETEWVPVELDTQTCVVRVGGKTTTLSERRRADELAAAAKPAEFDIVSQAKQQRMGPLTKN